ncbi:hypothetical protein [Arthrobacter sp. FW306-04-A]|uniref:hypothetical protein n=1 Tax=Arthrobacter sp. FW306-04-A TaxID=2879619 RepID=UPI0037C175DA|nr:hypothetical protein LFT43_03235 [Arthrobacter sp. FW306-04-A]
MPLRIWKTASVPAKEALILRRRSISITACYAPSTLGPFLRAFAFRHVRQLDALASRFLGNLAGRAPLLGAPAGGDFVFVDVDDWIIEVHGYAKEGSGYGYSGAGPERAPATALTKDSAQVIPAAAQRAADSARGAKRLIAEAFSTLKSVHAGQRVPCRFDSAFHGHDSVAAALIGGAAVPETVRMDPAVKRAIAGILPAGHFGNARTGTIRRKLIHVPARIVSSARRIRLHLPEACLWQAAWEDPFTTVHVPPQAA